MARATLLDIAKLTGNDKVVGLIEENILTTPELNIVPARTIAGTSFKTSIRTGWPTVGFRNANEGTTASKSTFRQDLVQCYIMNGRVEVDKAVAAAYEDGAGAYEMIEASGVMKAALQTAGRQFFDGTTANAKGFGGLKAFVPYGASEAAAPFYVNATGSTAATATSVYFVKFGMQDVQLIVGQGGAIDLSPFRDETIYDADDAPIPGRVADLMAWAGLQIGNKNCVVRIGNITEDSGKGLTDALMYQALYRFPIGIRPDAIFMSKRSYRQLQLSRTVTLQGNGTVRPNQPVYAPPFQEFDGIPVYQTDSITNTEVINS